MATVVKKQKGPGRPKKKKQVPKEDYKGIVDKPEKADAIFEVLLTEPYTLLQYLQTLKSNETSSIKILVTPTEMTFKSVIKFKPKSTADIAKKANNKTMFIKITGAKVFRYYCEEPLQVDISSIAAIDSIIEYCDQYSENILFYIRRRNTNMLNFEIFNQHLDVNIKSHVQAAISSPTDSSEYETNFDYDATRIKFIKYNAEHFKKLLVKRSTKSAHRFNISAKGNIMRIEITTADGIIDTLEFDVSNNPSIEICKPDELYSAHFPKTDVFQFITHIKASVDIFINKQQLFIEHSDLGMSMNSIVDLSV